jgi:hypothetical protein
MSAKHKLGKTGDASQNSSSASPEPAKQTRKSRGGFGRSLMLLTLAAVLALALSEGMRSKVLDLLFGAEEEFDYSSTTTPATPAPAAAMAGS